MPVYTFVCKKCGNEQEELVSMGTEVFKCSKCGGQSKKVMSLCSFHLKGSGWYKDHYSVKKESSNGRGSK